MNRKRIGLALRATDNDYQQRLRADALTVAAELGFEIEVVAAQNDSNRQQQQITKLVEGPKGPELAAVLVSAVRDDVLGDVARLATKAGIGWVVLHREAPYLAALRDEFPTLPTFAVTPDQEQIGRIQGQQVKALLGDAGHVLTVTGPLQTSSAQKRLDGLRAVLGSGTFTITVLESNWSSEGARMALEKWLAEQPKGTRPSIVASQNDEMALGARQALRDGSIKLDDAALEKVPITGVDGSPSFGQRLVREKRIIATVDVPSTAGPALQALARSRDTGERPAALMVLPISSYPELTALSPRP